MTLIERLSKLDGPDHIIAHHEGALIELRKGTEYGPVNDAKAISHHMGRIAILRSKEASNGK